MHLKGLRRVVSVTIWTRSCEGKHGTRKNEGSKSVDQEDGRDECGRYKNCEKLCSGGAKGAMKTGHGIGSASAGYGGSDGDDSSGGRNGRAQNGGTKIVPTRRKKGEIKG